MFALHVEIYSIIEWEQKLVLFDITGPSLKDKYPIRTNYVVLVSMHNIGIVCMLLCYIRGPAQDSPYDLILWYVSKIIYLL